MVSLGRMKDMGNIIGRARTLYHQGGPLALFRGGLAVLTAYERNELFVCKEKIVKRNEADFLPDMEGFSLCALSSAVQLDQMIGEGFDFVRDLGEIRRRLRSGAVAHVIFVEKELAAIDWMATNESAKDSFNKYPYKVSFLNREACAGGGWTNPRLRGHGFFTYLLYKHREYLIRHGYDTLCSLINVRNTASLKAAQKFAPEFQVTGKAISTRIFGIPFWKQTPK
jgi:hypothetical protein